MDSEIYYIKMQNEGTVLMLRDSVKTPFSPTRKESEIKTVSPSTAGERV